jgi:tetratricopeptide (TPR) repeat protein
MARKPPATPGLTAFARLLTGHLAKGTRPASEAGEPWTYADFAAELPGRRNAASASERNVSNWCRGHAVPTAIDPILRALFGPESSSRHATARTELRDAFVAARNLARLQAAPPDPVAMAWEERDGRLALRVGAPPSDADALNDPFVRSMHPQVTAKAKALLDPAARLRNSRGWEGLAPATERLHAALCCDTDGIVPQLAALYSAMLELGSFYEQHNGVQPGHSLDPLAPDVARPLSDLLRTGAPWLRQFETIRRQDDAAGAFLTRRELFEPARQFLRTAHAHDLVSTEDRQSVDALLDAGARGDFVGQKAANRAVATVTALARAGTLAVATFLAGAVSSDFATKSVLVQRAGDVLRDGEQHALALAAPLQSDLQVAITETLSGLRPTPADQQLPANPPIEILLPSGSDPQTTEINRLVARGNEARANLEHELAIHYYISALDIARAENHLAGQARCLFLIAEIALARFDHAAATQGYENALPIFRIIGDVIGAANCIMRLGDVALRSSDHATAAARYEEALPLHRKVSDTLGEANCIKGIGDIALRRSDHATATARFEEALPLYRRAGDVLGEANCIRSLGDIALGRSDHARATARYEEALPLYRRIGAVLGEANCIKSLGDIALRISDHATATGRFDEAMELYRRIGVAVGQANCIASLGDIALVRSDHATATARFEEALPLYRGAGDVLGEANCIRSLGTIAVAHSDHATATARFEEALQLFRRVGHLLGEGNCIFNLGDIALASSDLASATARFKEALPLYRCAGDLLGEANCTMRVGDIARDRTDHATATACYEEALPLYRRAGDMLGEANCIRSLGDIARTRSDDPIATVRYNEALPLYRRVGNVLGEANCIRSLGDIARNRGDAATARTRYETALTLYRRIPVPYNIGSTHLRLANLPDAPDRDAHLAAAREAWLSINRTDLIAEHLPPPT